MPRYTVLVHRRVLRFLEGLSDGTTKVKIKDATEKLANYPFSLRELDVTRGILPCKIQPQRLFITEVAN